MVIEKSPLDDLVMNPDFWKNKRVFLTGHTGFKGGWLSLWLQDLGVELTGFALPPFDEGRCIFNAANVGKGMNSLFGDVRNYNDLYQSIKFAQPEIVIHMAAQPLVKYSYQDPIGTYSTNVMGTVNLLEAVRKNKGIKAVINVTSDKCYDNCETTIPYTENNALGGRDPYSNSKACSELVTSAFRDSFFDQPNSKSNISVATVRAGNVIGGGDFAANRLIPDVLAACDSGRDILIRNPNAIRPWQFVLEPLIGYLILAERLFEFGPKFSGPWNFGPNQQISESVHYVVNQLLSLVGTNRKWMLDTKMHSYESTLLKLDISKSKNLLKWKPVLELKEALQMTVDWHLNSLNGKNMYCFSLDQIRQYQSRFLKG
jgi:CDP-glucose 4,6-dehydratase